MHPGNWVAIKRAVVYYAQAHAFSAGIKSRHCRCKDGSHPTKTRNSTKKLLQFVRCHCKTGCLTKHYSCRIMGMDAR